MREIHYRRLEKKDYPEVQNLLNDAFGLHQYVEDEKTLTLVKKMYLQSCLAEQKFNRVAVCEGQVVGIIMGASHSHKTPLAILKNAVQLLYFTMKVWLKTRKKKGGGLNTVNRTYNEMLRSAEENFDGVLTLFAVRADMQGYGVGKELLSQLNQYYSAHQTNKVYLFTDDKCNYGFYEHMGFSRLKEQTVKVKRANKETSMDVYLYAIDTAKLK